MKEFLSVIVNQVYNRSFYKKFDFEKIPTTKTTIQYCSLQKALHAYHNYKHHFIT